ncbi:MAG: cell division protein ZapE [Gammaproteobacteria bacterium]|nr:cell division protein ZapE [Gammaproteobacteria bacterium]
MTPREQYQIQIRDYGYQADPQQADAIDRLDKLHHELIARDRKHSAILTTLAIQLGIRTKPVLEGVYLWGGVGRGKTWLMDLFFENLPLSNKFRIHFHQFMQVVIDELELLKGHQNPLKLVARNFSRRFQVLCLDEFHVADITHAMLLYGLLEAMYKEGIILVATSNRQPDELYKNGLQRDRFLPAIELIKQFSEIIHIDGDADYRLRLLEQSNIWYQPITDDSESQLIQRFSELAPCTANDREILYINYRNIQTRCRADDVVWFDFNIICNTPRASSDYLVLARIFSTIFISSIPVMDEFMDDMARRFINLIDALYDRNVKLIISADCEPAELYQGSQLAFPFKRTISRLEEMRSHAYLCKPHKP